MWGCIRLIPFVIRSVVKYPCAEIRSVIYFSGQKIVPSTTALKPPLRAHHIIKKGIKVNEMTGGCADTGGSLTSCLTALCSAINFTFCCKIKLFLILQRALETRTGWKIWWNGKHKVNMCERNIIKWVSCYRLNYEGNVIATCLYVIRVSLLWARFYVPLRVIFQFIASKTDGKVTMCDSRIAPCHRRLTSFQSPKLLCYIAFRTFKIISFGMSERLQTTKTYSTDST